MADDVSYTVITWPIAEEDIRRITAWFFESRPHSLNKWLDDLTYIEQTLRQNPFQYPEKYLFTRRALFRNFPYSVVYIVDERAVEVEIIMVYHQHQDPNELPRRLNLP